MPYAESAMGEKLVTVASSPFSAAVMTRLYRRSNRSRGDMLLMSGGGPPAAAPPANRAFAATSAAGARAPRVRKISRPAMRALPSAPVSTHRTRSPVLLGTPAGLPQLEQNWVPAPRGVPQPAQVRATRFAPQEPQNFPDARAPQAAQT